jgi:hypothetical protein
VNTCEFTNLILSKEKKMFSKPLNYIIPCSKKKNPSKKHIPSNSNRLKSIFSKET